MAELITAGSVEPIRIFPYDGQAIKAGLTGVAVSIERLSDGKYYDGAAWQAAYTTITMTELTGNAAVEGEYEYQFTTPATPDAFNWSVKHTIDGSDAYFKGRIRTQ